MAASRSTQLETRARGLLLRVAAGAIEARLGGGPATAPDAGALPSALHEARASFVTLTMDGRLRGCCGSLETNEPLAVDVWRNARRSAFEDPRFPPLRPQEWPAVELEISVLSRLEPIAALREPDVLEQIVPGEHGLVLAWRGTRATFLPRVWSQLPDPRDFLRQLKQKAGWSEDFWASDVVAWRYEAEVFGGSSVPAPAAPLPR